MKHLSPAVCVVLAAGFGGHADAEQDDSRYHSCDNVQAFVQALILPSLDDQQKLILKTSLLNKGVTNLQMFIEPGNNRGQTINIARRIQPERNYSSQGSQGEPLKFNSSFRLMFGSTALDVTDENSCTLG